MAIMRSAPGLDLARTEPAPADQDSSFADLATRLAQESVALAGVEIRRLGVEVRHRRRHAVRALASGIIAAGLAGVGAMALAGGAVLYLGRMWQDYAAGAAATGVLFLLLAGGVSFVLISAIRGLTRAAEHDTSPGTGNAPERNRTDGT